MSAAADVELAGVANSHFHGGGRVTTEGEVRGKSHANPVGALLTVANFRGYVSQQP